jgi:hypothetical protein
MSKDVNVRLLTPFVGTVVGLGVAASVLLVLERRHLEQTIVEYLVLVMVDRNILRIVVRRGEEAVPDIRRFKSIVQDDRSVGDLTDLAEAIAIELLCNVEAKILHVKGWLVQQLDSDDDVLVLSLGIFLRDGLEYLKCLQDGVASLPLWAVGALSRIIVSILRAWRAVEIDNDFESKASCPVHSSVDIYIRALNVRRPESVIRPVANGDAHHIEARLLDFVEVLPSHEGVPVLPEYAEGRILTKKLPEGIFVDDVFLWPILICGIKD